MTYDEFYLKVADLDIYVNKNDSLEVSWETGGMSGGNCWGGSAEPYYTGNSEPEFTSLDTVLEAICPNISFMQYKRLCQELVHITDETHSEYYGNYSDVKYKRVLLKELYYYLNEKKLLPVD